MPIGESGIIVHVCTHCKTGSHSVTVPSPLEMFCHSIPDYFSVFLEQYILKFDENNHMAVIDFSTYLCQIDDFCCHHDNTHFPQ